MSRRNWYLLTNSVVLLWIVLTIVAVSVHRFVSQPLWLIVHVPLLGAASAAMLIWTQHFADTLLRRPAPIGRPGLAARLALHSAGAGLVVVGMLLPSLPIVIVGAATVSAAVVGQAVLLFVQLRRALPARFAPLVHYYVTAGVVFLGGIALGVAMRASDDPDVRDRVVTAHIALNAFGWVGITALGTLILLWPTVLHARMKDSVDRAARHALPALAGGVALAGAGPLLNLRWLVTAGMAIWLVGAVRIAVEGWHQARAMPPGTFTGWSLASAFGWLLVSAGALAGLALIAPGWTGLREGYLIILVPLVVGFGFQLLIGAFSYLLPVVAMGSPRGAKAAAEVLDRGAAFRVSAFNGAIGLYLLPMPSLSRVLLSFVVLGVVVAFVVLVVRSLVVGRRVARQDGPAPDRSGRVSVGMPQAVSPPVAPRRVGVVTTAFVLLALCVTGGVAADPAAVGISTAPQPGDIVASGETTTVTVSVHGMRFDPARIDVPYGNELVVTFRNTGTDVHDLTFANGTRTARLAPGESETIGVGIIGADLDGWCSIAGHRQMGMELTVIAIGAPNQAADAPRATDATTANSHGGHTGGESPSAADDIDLSAAPGKGFEPWPATLAPAVDEQVHRYTLRVQETEQEVAPGIRQARWTFGGSAPGPVLRGTVGDTFEITLVNDGSIGHSIDFHAGALAPNTPMRTIQPGETLTYTFTASQAGIWMYHCSTMPMSMHIANGMYGAVIIDPRDLAPVDREYVIVQSELYLGPQSGPADADKIASQAPDLVVFNGYANQYLHRPLGARSGERVRVWLLDAGPNVASSFHVVGGQFDVTYLEGSYTLKADEAGGSQALALQPAQGGFVELTFPEAGDYPFVTHKMSDAEKGAQGVFHVE